MFQFYSIEDICKTTGFSRGGVYKQIKQGLFTKPLKWGKSSKWPEIEVHAIFKARIAEKSDDEIRALVAQLHAARTADVNARQQQ